MKPSLKRVAPGIFSVLASALVILLGSTLALKLLSASEDPSVPVKLLATGLQLLSFLLIIPIAMVIQKNHWKELFHFQLPNRRDGIIWGGVFIGYIALLNGFLLYFERTQSVDAMLPFWRESMGGSRILFIFNVVILAPIAEEVLFRGYLFGSLRQVPGGLVSAAVVPSAVWTLLHGQYMKPVVLWPELTGLFVMGICLCLVRYKAKSLWLPIMLHILNNTIGVCVLWVES